MNPEFQRNLWLEATPFRLALMAGMLLLIFLAAAITPGHLVTPEATARAAYFFIVVLWGTRNAALGVIGEIRERTWDSQRLSALGSGTMMWGKLFGATSYNWFGGAICLPFILVPEFVRDGVLETVRTALVLVTLGIYAQAVSLLSSLYLIRRRHDNWRLDIFLCHIAGILAAWVPYSLWSALNKADPSQTLSWWDRSFNLADFHLVSLLLFAGWAVLGCYRAMRVELRFENGPFVWLAFLVFLCVYDAGFTSLLDSRAVQATGSFDPAALRAAIAAMAMAATTYGMALLEPKDPVRLRWLGERVLEGRIGRAVLGLDCWMISYAMTVAVTGLLAVLLLRGEGDKQPVLFAIGAGLGFLTRDAAIFVLMRTYVRARGDFAALAILAALYLLAPAILMGLQLRDATMIFLPTLRMPSAAVALAAAWIEAGFVVLWAARRVGARAVR